jgi:hypothetical protein
MNNENRKIPTILGIFLLLGLIGGLIGLERTGVLRIRAGKEVRPQEVRQTNITSSSFTVSWVTNQPATGMVKVKLDGQERIFIDLRDTIGQPQKYTTHYVEVKGLDPNTTYQYVLMSNGNEFSNGSGDYQQRTAQQYAQQIPQANLASGRVVTTQNQPAKGAIVYVDIQGISPLSSLVTSQGNWAVSLAKAYTQNLESLADYQEGMVEENIFVQGAEKGTARGKTYTQQDDPVPTITLGDNFDFTTQDNITKDQELSKQPTESPSGQGGFSDDNIDLNQKKEFTIENPESGETIKVRRPEIFGTGPQGGKVKITLESSTKYEADLEIGSDQQWNWTPPQDLEPGSHSLTISYTDPETGQVEEFKRTFVLAAETDDGPAFSATPSGNTVTPTSTPTNTPTPEPTAEPTTTIAPTSTTAPTESPTTPTSEPRTSQPSTESGVPQSGFWQITGSLLLGGAIIFMLLGWQII